MIELHRRFKTTLIHVTHDQSEALLMGDRVVILEKGQLRQCGEPRVIYDHPSHRFVATFVGSPPMNLLPCQFEWDGETPRFAQSVPSELYTGTSPSASCCRGWEGTTRIFDLGIRPEAISVRHESGATEPTPTVPSLSARVRRLEFNGPELLATLAVGPHRLIARLPANQALEDGQRVEAVSGPGASRCGLIRRRVRHLLLSRQHARRSLPAVPRRCSGALRRQSIPGDVQNPLELSFDLGQSLSRDPHSSATARSWSKFFANSTSELGCAGFSPSSCRATAAHLFEPSSLAPWNSFNR